MATFCNTIVDRPRETVTDAFKRIHLEEDTVQYPEKESNPVDLVKDMLNHPIFNNGDIPIHRERLSHDIVMFKFMLTRITGMFNIDFPDIYVDVYIDSERRCCKVDMDTLPINTDLDTFKIRLLYSAGTTSYHVDKADSYTIFAYVLDYVFSIRYDGKSYKTSSVYHQAKDSDGLTQPNIRWFNSWGSDFDEVEHKEFYPRTVAEILNLDQLVGINYSNAFKDKVVYSSDMGWSNVNINVKNMLELIDLGKVFAVPAPNRFKYFCYSKDVKGIDNNTDISDLAKLTYDLWNPKYDEFDKEKFPERAGYSDYGYIYKVQSPKDLFVKPRFAGKFNHNAIYPRIGKSWHNVDDSEIRPEILEANEIVLSILKRDIVDSTVYRTETIEIEIFQVRIKINVTVIYRNAGEHPLYHYYSENVIPEILANDLDYLLLCTFGPTKMWDSDMRNFSKIGFFKALCEEGVNTNMDLMANLEVLKDQHIITFRYKYFESDAILFTGISDMKATFPGKNLILLDVGMSQADAMNSARNRFGCNSIIPCNPSNKTDCHLISVDYELLNQAEFEGDLTPIGEKIPIFSVEWGLLYLQVYNSNQKIDQIHCYKLLDSEYSKRSLSIEQLAQYFQRFGEITDINGIFFKADFNIEREIVKANFNLDKFMEV